MFQLLHVHIFLKETMCVRVQVFNKDGKEERLRETLVVVLQCDSIPTGKLNFRLSSSLTAFRLVCPWNSANRSRFFSARAFHRAMLRARGSVPALSFVFPLTLCCRTPRPNSLANLCISATSSLHFSFDASLLFSF